MRFERAEKARVALRAEQIRDALESESRSALELSGGRAPARALRRASALARRAHGRWLQCSGGRRSDDGETGDTDRAIPEKFEILLPISFAVPG